MKPQVLLHFFRLTGFLLGYFRLSYFLVVFLSINAIFNIFFIVACFYFKTRLFNFNGFRISIIVSSFRLIFFISRQFFSRFLVLHRKWREAQLRPCVIN